MLSQDDLDLSQLDPVATDLHLVVEPSQIFETTVGPIPDTVASPIKALTGTGRKGLQ